jgi:hypothetical protein
MASKAQKKSGYLLPSPTIGYPPICVSFQIPDAPEYRAAVRGHLAQLGKWWKWERSGEDTDRRATQVALIFRHLLNDTLQFNEECFPEVSGCTEYGNTSYIIEYFPNHPHDQNTPVGYLFPPWYIAPVINLIGAPYGAAVTDITRFPYVPGQPAESLPRFRVHFVGAGVIELHLVRINFGGNAIIQVDNDLLQVEVVGLNQDNVAIPPETEDVIIIERTINTPGAHHIDVTIVPVLQNDIPPVYFGGGLMKVVTCGFDDMTESIEWRHIAIDAQCDQLQWKYTTEDETAWRNVGTPICDGADGQDGADGAQGPQGPAGEQGLPGEPGECPECDPPEVTEPETGENNCAGVFGLVETLLGILNYNLNQLEYFVDVTYELVNLVTVNFLETIDSLPVIGLITASLNFAKTLGVGSIRDDINNPNFKENVVCWLYCEVEAEGAFNQTSFDAWIAKINTEYPSLTDGARVFVDLASNVIEFDKIARRYAIESLNTDARCASLCECGEWCYAWNEPTLNNFDQNWVAAINPGGVPPAAEATFADGSGWDSVRINQSNSPSDPESHAVIDLTFPAPVTLTRIRFTYEANSTYPVVIIQSPTGEGNELPLTFPNGGVEWNGNQSFTSIRLGVRKNDPNHNSTATLKSVTIFGEGENPFGTDNCEEA